MEKRLLAVLDIGKTVAKLSLWSDEGEMVARATRPNQKLQVGDHFVLDVAGIENWIAGILSDFATKGRIDAIIPVSHGAAAVIIRDGKLAYPPLDYEDSIPAPLRAEYDRARDPFALTGSPALPDGLNLGAQLYFLQSRHPDLLNGDSQILPWAQFWSWRLSGVARSEVTSLGCHTDLWCPNAGQPSPMAQRFGWADRFAPLARAGEVIGTLTPEWVLRTGLPAETRIYCGIHDSNAALVAARGFPEIAQNDSTVLSTGTWFVAMRTPAPGAEIDFSRLDERRDCLINIDAEGCVVPSARFMGGREIEKLSGVDARRVDIKPDQPLLLAAVAEVVAKGSRVLPTFAPGFGPFPDGPGRMVDVPDAPHSRRAAVCLYVALMANVSLDLVGARGAILIEGRFAEAEVFVRALAALRPQDRVYVSNAHADVSYGALRLIGPELRPASMLVPVEPLQLDLTAYHRQWRQDVERLEPVR